MDVYVYTRTRSSRQTPQRRCHVSFPSGSSPTDVFASIEGSSDALLSENLQLKEKVARLESQLALLEADKSYGGQGQGQPHDQEKAQDSERHQQHAESSRGGASTSEMSASVGVAVPMSQSVPGMLLSDASPEILEQSRGGGGGGEGGEGGEGEDEDEDEDEDEGTSATLHEASLGEMRVDCLHAHPSPVNFLLDDDNNDDDDDDSGGASAQEKPEAETDELFASAQGLSLSGSFPPRDAAEEEEEEEEEECYLSPVEES